MLITLGTDPELVGIAKSAEHLRKLNLSPDMVDLPIPGYFALPVKNPKSPDLDLPHGKLRPDGMALEFTVQPTNDVDEMVRRIGANILATAALARITSGTVLNVAPKFYTAPYWIDRLPEEYGDACSLQVLGCAPDFQAYDMDVPDRPDPKTTHYRTSGGHIHFGIGKAAEDTMAVAYITAALDALIGTASTFLSPSAEAYERKEMYGRAGMVRTKPDNNPYILEYRTLSAQALIQTPKIARLMFSAGQAIVDWMTTVYYTSTSEAVETFGRVVGNLNQVVDVAEMINRHDLDGCRAAHRAFVDRIADDNINALSHQLCDYVLPSDFDLHGWE